MKSFRRLPLIVGTLGVLAASPASFASPDAGWVSLYNGRESRFSDQDRRKVLAVLDRFNIDHRKGPQAEIFILESTRDQTQDLIAQVIFKIHDERATTSAR